MKETGSSGVCRASESQAIGMIELKTVATDEADCGSTDPFSPSLNSEADFPLRLPF